jgi:hypothetical protein
MLTIGKILKEGQSIKEALYHALFVQGDLLVYA